MLSLAEVGEEDVVYDLGSGDGRLVIAAVRDFGAKRAVGVEIDPELIELSIEKARVAGVDDRVAFLEQDLFTADFSEATVVTLYLGHSANIQLRPKLFRLLKPGARVVSHQSGMGEWTPDKILTMKKFPLVVASTTNQSFRDNAEVPAYRGNEPTFGEADAVMLWSIPDRAAGVWRGTVEMLEDDVELKFVLRQRLGRHRGEIHVDGVKRYPPPFVYTLESRIGFWSGPEINSGAKHFVFAGELKNDCITGTLRIGLMDDAVSKEVELRRDPADLIGLWQATPTEEKKQPFQLRLEPGSDGLLKGTYIDGKYEAVLEDFYDFGGGIYFTVYRDADNAPRKASDGWLIGDAVLVDGTLQGVNVFHDEFYPVEDMKLRQTQDWIEWTAQRIEE